MSHHILSPEQVRHRLAQGTPYLDVRTVEEFVLGHIPQAYNLPVSLGSLAGLRPNPEFVEVFMRNFGRTLELIIGCRSGARARTAARRLHGSPPKLLLDPLGWEGSRDAFGRLNPGWVGRGGEIAAQAGPGRSYRELGGSF